MEPAPASEMMHCTSTLKQMPGSHLGLLQWGLCIRPVDHTEGDPLWFWGKSPGDSGARRVHDDGDDAVTAGLDEKLSGAVPKPQDVIHREWDRQPAAQTQQISASQLKDFYPMEMQT